MWRLLAGGLAAGGITLLARPRFPIPPVRRIEVNAGWAGSRPYPRNHQALDIIAGLNEPVRAVDDGVVIAVHRRSTGDAGLNIRIRHHVAGLGPVVSRYAHLNPGTIPDYIQVGKHLHGGTFIAGAGTTGRSLNPHLHFESWICDGKTMQRYLKLFGRAPKIDVARAMAGKCTKVPSESLIRADVYHRDVAAVSAAAGVTVLQG